MGLGQKSRRSIGNWKKKVWPSKRADGDVRGSIREKSFLASGRKWATEEK